MDDVKNHLPEMMAVGELSLYLQCAWTNAWPLVSTQRMFVNCPAEYPSTGKGRLVDWLCLGQQESLKGDYYSTTARAQLLTIDLISPWILGTWPC